jgi:hypothetical protein
VSEASEAALAVLAWAADPQVTTAAQRSVEAGTHRWVYDPDVDGVVGLVLTSDARQSVLTVWLEAEDFEVDHGWLESNHQ